MEEEKAMASLCDLHTHSHFSDGTLSPTRLLDAAEQAGLAAVALTDHNTVAGLPEFMAAARGRGVEAVPGIEFSTDYQGTELHILGLFIQSRHYGKVTALLDEALARKERSNIDLVEKLQKAGYDIDYAAIKGKTPNGQVNRALIAAALTEQGYTASIRDAFQKLLSPEQGYYIPPERLNAFDVIRFIGSIGAVAVLAHPFLNLKEGELRVFLEQAKKYGLDGMETLYPMFDEAQTRSAQAIADEFGLLHSGGSDFHGGNKPHIQLGTGQGSLAVPLPLLTALKQRRM